jgi:hypothetical protein
LATQRVEVGEGWSLSIPVEFHAEVNADGSWSAWDARRTIDVHILSTSDIDGELVPAIEMLGLPAHDQHQYRLDSGDGLEGYADLRQDSDNRGPIFRLSATSAVDNRLISCWLAFRDMRQVPWALDVWGSIENDGSPRGEPLG